MNRGQGTRAICGNRDIVAGLSMKPGRSRPAEHDVNSSRAFNGKDIEGGQATPPDL